jgi:hypothetical protein
MTSRILIDELTYLLTQQDPNARILFVEGVRDQRFLTQLVPLAERLNASVLPISDVEIPEDVLDGNRGRVIWLANYLAEELNLLDRALFFIDGDLDRFLQIARPPNVELTDFSDLESYVINECSLSNILFAFGREPASWPQLRDAILRVCRPLKIARAASARLSLELPINATLGGEERGRLRRYINGEGIECKVEAERLVSVIHQNAGSSAEVREKFAAACDQMGNAELDAEHWCQGRDLAGAMANIFGVRFEEAWRLIWSALHACLEVIRTMPALNRIDVFLRT